MYLARHGQTALNRENRFQGSMDEPLSQHGVEEVEELKKQIQDLPIDVIVCSSYERAKQTADILNAERGVQIEVFSDLREQSFGEYEGRDLKEIGVEPPKGMNPYQHLRTDPPKGESYKDYEKRVLKAMKTIRAKYADKNVLIVAHAGNYHVLNKQRRGITAWKSYCKQNFVSPPTASFHVLPTSGRAPANKLDRWILSELHTLVRDMTAGLDEYDLAKGLDPLVRFIDSLTNWYIRRSRRRFWKSENDGDKSQAYQTLYTVLVEICKLLAPFAPFITEEMYRNLTALESVHLADWPEVNEKVIDEELNQEIALAQQIVTLGHAARSKANVKVRQPLQKIEVALPPSPEGGVHESRLHLAEQIDVIREELNIKEIVFLDSVTGKVQIMVKPNAKILGPKYGAAVQHIIREAKAGNYQQLANGNYQVLEYELTPEEIEIAYESLSAEKGHQQVQADRGMVVILDTHVTAELLREGYARDIVRTIQDLRKQADLNVSDHIIVGLSTESKDIQHAISEFQSYIMKETLATEITAEKRMTTWEAVVNLGEHGITVTIEKA
jgi:broad specificity phosphatase PhoE